MKGTDIKFAFFLGIGLLLFSIQGPVYYGSDADYVVPQLVSIFQHGDQNIDEYSHLYGEQYQIRKVGNHYYDAYPYGIVYLALPPAFVLNAIYGADYLSLHRDRIAVILASCLMAVATMLVFFMSRLRGLNRWRSGLLALFAGLGTSMLSTGSRAPWQQSGVMLIGMGLLCLLILHRRKKDAGTLTGMGLLLGLGFMVRPLMVLYAAGIGLYLLFDRESRKGLHFFVLPGLAVAALFVWQSFHLFDAPLPPYYLADSSGFNFDYANSIPGMLFSPNRGFFAWHPAFLFSAIALVSGTASSLRYAALRLRIAVSDFFPLPERKSTDQNIEIRSVAARVQNERTKDSFLPFALLIVLGHGFIVASYEPWWGGHSLGPRLLSDLIPLFLYALVPFIRRMDFAHPAFALTLFVCMAFSCVVHIRCIFVPEMGAWNRSPVDINLAPERVWDSDDLQWFR